LEEGEYEAMELKEKDYPNVAFEELEKFQFEPKTFKRIKK
jgi:hypothetical protein